MQAVRVQPRHDADSIRTGRYLRGQRVKELAAQPEVGEFQGGVLVIHPVHGVGRLAGLGAEQGTDLCLPCPHGLRGFQRAPAADDAQAHAALIVFSGQDLDLAHHTAFTGAVVEMNYKAIDLGATAYVKIDVPADWANAVDEAPAKELTGRPATVKMVRDILTPVDKMDGDSLPVSAFVDHADGTFELGASAYEKRGVAVSVPEWDSTKCIQCNQCAYVCPHATIRPFALTADELAAAPAQTKAVDFKVGAGKGVYKFSMAISPLDCMGCGVCTHVCPVGALTMQPLESQEDQQPVFDYMVAKVAEKKELQDFTVKGSQFRQPMLEFSGSCAGCAETSYARLVTQLFGDHMMISNATGCSSIWGGPAATSPYTVNKEGKGPAWANSLFEDNAEHGLGMYLGQKKIRDDLAEDIRYIAENGKDPAKVAAAKKYLETYNDGEANQTATAEFLAVMEAKPACDCERYQRIMTNKDFLNKKSCWIFGGDGWAYDIGFGGLDHVLAQDEDVNVFVFNTEVYSNTGGQASKASNIGQVAQFAAAGKELKSKSLADRW